MGGEVCAFLLLALTACTPAPSAPPPTPRGPTEVTLLFTSDEHGWLLPRAEKGRVHGGAAEVLGLWMAAEGHCPGPPSPPCKDPRTLALSGGDNFTGPAVSTYFAGAPMAEAMARMGYAASAFGNHELDFGREQFHANARTSGVTYLAANLHAAPERADMALGAWTIFERRGLKIGVVGLATDTTLRTAMASRFEGVTFEAEEPALSRAVGGAWAAGADMVVAIAHECPDVLAPIVARHPEWRLAFVGAGHCHKLMSLRAGGVPVIAPGWRLDHYVRVLVRADTSRPPRERVLAVTPDVVTMSRPEGSPPSVPPDPVLARAGEAWRAKVDAVLGQEIGWSAAGIEKGSPEMGRWIAGAIRAETGADVAVVNVNGMRQSLPRGPVTKASVWSILPFDNQVVALEIDGAALAENLRSKDAVFAGATRGAGSGFVLAGGRPLDPKGVYKVATIDYLYFGGDHFTFQKHARAADVRHADWRDVVIAWTARQRTSREAPLEARLPP